MDNYMDVINRYEGKGIPYRDRNDDIRLIVSNMCYHMSNSDDGVIKHLIEHYKCFNYINNILVSGNKCVIEYDKGYVSFNVLPRNFLKVFCDDVFGLEKLSGECHYVTQKILESCRSNDISAVTSLCINVNYLFYFHSYIHDRNENKIIDFARNFIMDKDIYDKLFCYYQINDFNYSEYKHNLFNSSYDFVSDKCFSLLYLALDKLEKDDLDIDSGIKR